MSEKMMPSPEDLKAIQEKHLTKKQIEKDKIREDAYNTGHHTGSRETNNTAAKDELLKSVIPDFKSSNDDDLHNFGVYMEEYLHNSGELRDYADGGDWQELVGGTDPIELINIITANMIGRVSLRVRNYLIDIRNDLKAQRDVALKKKNRSKHKK